jgi:hypothetical protein
LKSQGLDKNKAPFFENYNIISLGEIISKLMLIAATILRDGTQAWRG